MARNKGDDNKLAKGDINQDAVLNTPNGKNITSKHDTKDKDDNGLVEVTINDNGRKWRIIREPVTIQQWHNKFTIPFGYQWS